MASVNHKEPQRRETKTKRERDRQKDRCRDRQRGRYRDRQKDRCKDRKTEIERVGKEEGDTCTHRKKGKRSRKEFQFLLRHSSDTLKGFPSDKQW